MKRTVRWTATFATLLAVGAPLTGQVTQQQRMARQQQMEQAQQRMQQLDQMVQRMDQVQERIREMTRTMQQSMDQLRARDATGNQDRIRQHERVRDMGEAMGQMAQQMRQTMLQLRAMEGDQLVQQDQVMQREMEQLRLHLRTMAESMEEGMKIMEQLHNRVRMGVSAQNQR